MMLLSMQAQSQYIIPLYDGEIPGAKPSANRENSKETNKGVTLVSGISRPNISVYLPARKINTGTAIIIFPGGGYQVNAIQHEGLDVGEYLASKGIAAFVVKYRLPDSAWMVDPARGPLQDALQAVRKVRQNASQYGIDPGKIGVLGFSAGGHLAACASNLYRNDPEGKALRPSFSVLIYPVISFSEDIGHTGSREALLGKQATPGMILAFSVEKQVQSDTPPAFLVHAKDDPVKYANSLAYQSALKRHSVPVELLSYSKGGHGFGMNNKASRIYWPEKMISWMKKQGYLNPRN